MYLLGEGKREPRSLRNTGRSKMSLQPGHGLRMLTTKLCLASVCPAKKMPQKRKCEVTFTYNPVNHDELQLNVGEIIEVIREVESHFQLLGTILRHLCIFYGLVACFLCFVLVLNVCCIFLKALMRF